MSNETDKERINYLEKRVEELQKKLAAAENPRIFFKVLITLVLVGSGFLVWKCRTYLKWGILALLAWWIFGGTVMNVLNTTGNFISTTWSDWKANGKVEDEHERAMERLRAEAETANSRTKAESDARVSEVRATADADNSRTKTEAEARAQVLKVEDAVKQSEWERNQAERRNEAVNDAIRSGHWTSTTQTKQPEIATPSETKVTDSPEPKNQFEPTIRINTPGREPEVKREVFGNITRVIVRF